MSGITNNWMNEDDLLYDEGGGSNDQQPEDDEPMNRMNIRDNTEQMKTKLFNTGSPSTIMSVKPSAIINMYEH